MSGMLGTGAILVWAALGGGGASHTDGTAVIGTVGVDRAFGRWVEVEGHAGMGGIGPHANDGVGVVRLGAGARITPVHSDVRPFLYGGLAHWHENSYTNVRHRPMASLGGDETAGVHHRTGVEFGAGVNVPIVPRSYVPYVPAFTQHIRAEARISSVLLPDKQGPGSYLIGDFALGFAF